MSNDRLDALRRQRALVAQHLAWLDAEIAAANGAPAPVFPPLDGPAPASLPPAPPALPVRADNTDQTPPAAEPDKLALANARATEILEQYAATDRFNPETTRRGCLLFAVAVFLFGVAAVLAVYFFRYR